MTTIKLKNGSGAPLAGDLVQGEPALDLTNKRLYTEDSGGSVIEVGTNPTSLTTGTFTSTGIDDNATSTAITIDASENVGIGTTSPSELLHVSGSGGVYGRITETNTSGTVKAGLILERSSTNTDFLIENSGNLTFSTASDASTWTERMRVDSSGNAGINITNPTEKLHVGGNILATGDITAYSDERLKSNIETLDGSKVYDMRGVSFTKDGESGSGVIAQELQKVAPELVNESGEYLSVAYGNLVGYLIEAVKELKAEIDELKGAK